MTIRLITIAILLSISIDTIAQNDFVAIERKLTSHPLPKEEKLKLCDELSWKYQNLSFEKSRHYGLRGVSLARELKDKKMEGYLYLGLGQTYHLNSQFDSAKFYLEKSMHIAESISNTDMIFGINNALGNLYSDLSKFEKAIDYYQNNLRLARKLKNEFSVCYSSSNIGVVYMLLHNNKKAEEYLLKAKYIAEKNLKTGKIEEERQDYQNALAGILTNLDEIYCAEGLIDKGINYSKQAATIYHEIGLYTEEVTALLGVARNYLSKTDFANALENTNRAYIQAQKVGYSHEKSLCQRMFCLIYYQNGNIGEAERYAKKAVAQKDSTIADDLEFNSHLVKIYIDQGEKEQAKSNFDRYNNLIRKYSDKELQKSISEMEVKYDTEKKELTIIDMERKHRFNQWFTFSSLTILLLLIIILYFRFRIIKQKKRLAEQQIEKVEKEKQLIATQALLKGETQERTRLSKDLHDGLGGLLSVTKHKIAQMKGNLMITEENVEVFNSALEMLDSSIRELRRVAHNLMPESLMRYGLNAALNDFCKSTGKVTYHFFGNDNRFDQNLEITIFRIASELINNALKHSNADIIDVQYIKEEDRVSITIYDNGCGFEPSTLDLEKAGGLNNIRSRVASFNGRLDINSSPGKGAEISVEFNL